MKPVSLEKEIASTEDLIDKVNDSKGNNIKVKYIHDEQSKECSRQKCRRYKSRDCILYYGKK